MTQPVLQQLFKIVQGEWNGLGWILFMANPLSFSSDSFHYQTLKFLSYLQSIMTYRLICYQHRSNTTYLLKNKKGESDLLSLKILYQQTQTPAPKLIQMLKVKALFKTGTWSQDQNALAED